MKSLNEAISACRHCRFYQSEGRRGGGCQQLGVPVQGSWKACSLAIPPFATDWKKLAEITDWQPSSSNPADVVTSEVALPTLTLPEADAVRVARLIEEVF